MSTLDTQRPLNRATFPGVPASIEDLWAGSAILNTFDADRVEDVQAALRGATRVVNAMAGGTLFDVTLNGGATAGTDLKARRVFITSAALADERLTVLERLAITTGMAQHEAGHGRLTRPMQEAVQAEWGDAPRPHRLSNIIEDVRLERKGEARWPAYGGLFGLTLWWVAQRYPTTGVDAMPVTQGEAVNFGIAAARYSEHTVWGTDPAVLAERDWWQDWAHRAAQHDAPTGHVKAIREALQHIADLPEHKPADEQPEAPEQGESGDEPGEQGDESGSTEPGEGEQSDEGEQSEQGESGADGSISSEGQDADGEADEAAADSAGEGAGSGRTEAPAETPAAEASALDDESSLPLEPGDELTRTEIERDSILASSLRSIAEKVGRDQVKITHPMVNDPRWDESRERTVTFQPTVEPPPYWQTPGDLSAQAALRQAFTSRKTSHDAKSVANSGTVSSRRLYRARTGVGAVFTRREGISPDHLDVHLIVDASSSMGVPTRGPILPDGSPGVMTGTRMDQAQTLAANLTAALQRRPGTRVHVWAFTAQGHTPFVQDVLDTRKGQSIRRVLGISASGNTPSASALRAIGQRVLAERKPRERSIIVVLTDGRPSESNDWVRGAVNALTDKGVGVLAVGIASGLSDTLKQAFGHESVVAWHEDWRRLGRELGQAIGRLA